MLTLKHEWRALKKTWGKGGKSGLRCGRSRLRGIHRLVRGCTPKLVVRKKYEHKKCTHNNKRSNLFLSRFKQHRLRQGHTLSNYRTCPQHFTLIKATHFLFMRGNAIVVDHQIGFFVNQAKNNFSWKQESDGRWNCTGKKAEKTRRYDAFSSSP